MLFVCAVVGTQSDQMHGSVTIGISLQDGSDGSFRLYTERDRLEYDVRVSNGSQTQASVFVDQEVLRQVVAIRVELNAADVPVHVRWPDEVSVQHDDGTVTRFASWQPVELRSPEAVWFRVTLERQDQQRFDQGTYDIVFTVSDFESAIRRADGTPWRGITNANGAWHRGPTIQRPTSREDQIAAHQADAILARRRGDREAALEALLKAHALDPENGYIRLSLGLAYLGLGRYQEAIPIYESLLAGTARPDPLAARDLAKAYLGVRDEGNAVRLLRLIGVPEIAIRDEIDTLRRGLR
jgi:hypothetical protein